MKTSQLEDLIQRLPPGRARARYERMAQTMGEVFVLNGSCDDVSLWLVQDAVGANQLVQTGIPRWRIWTFNELRELMALFGTRVNSLAEAAGLFEGPYQ